MCELQNDELNNAGEALWEISFYLDSDKPTRLDSHVFSILERFEFPPRPNEIAVEFARNWVSVSIGMATHLQEIDENGDIFTSPS